MAAALVVFLAPGGRQVVGGAFGEAAFGLEPGKGLRGERNEFLEAQLAGFVFHKLDELAADALVLVGGADVEAGQFTFAQFGPGMQGDAGDGVFINFEDVVVGELFFDGGPGALDQFLAFHGAAGQVEDAADVLFQGAADLLELVAVDERADALVGEDFGQQAFRQGAVDDVDARHPGFAGGGGVNGLGKQVGGDGLPLERQDRLEVGQGHLADDAFADPDAVMGGDEHELGGLERLGGGQRDAIGIDAVGLAFAVEAQGGEDGDDALGEEPLEQLGVHALDLAGEKLVHPVQDAGGVGDDGVGAGGAEVVGGQALEDFVREPVGGGERELERGFVGDAGSVKVRGGAAGFAGQRANLGGGAMHEHDVDVQGAQDGNIHEEVGEVLVGDDRAVHVDDERLVAELRDVAENAPQVGEFHVSSGERAQAGAAAVRARAVWRAARQCLFSRGVPMEMRIHAGNW